MSEASNQLEGGGTDHIYRFPRRLGWFFALLSVVLLVAFPYLGAPAGHNPNAFTFVASGLFAAISAIWSYYFLVYFAAIEGDRVIVKGFVRREFTLSEIRGVRMSMTRNGRFAEVSIQGMRTIGFNGMLVGFSDLVEKLQRAAPVREHD